MEEVDGADDLDGDGLLGEEEELHVDRGSSVTSSRLPPPPCSRTILKNNGNSPQNLSSTICLNSYLDQESP